MTHAAPLEEGACGVTIDRCRCVKPAGHAEAGDRWHGCDPDRCGGEWYGSSAADFEVKTWPGGMPATDNPIVDLFRALLGDD